MIKCTIKRENTELIIDINGHAGYSKNGQDIVCAFVSALTYFLTTYTKKYARNTIEQLDINDGDVKLKLNNADKIKPLLEVFQLLMVNVQNQYPNCLKCEFYD